MSTVADEDLRVSLEADVADDLVVVAPVAYQVHPGLDVGARRVVEHVEVGRQRQAVLGIVILVLPAQLMQDANSTVNCAINKDGGLFSDRSPSMLTCGRLLGC